MIPESFARDGRSAAWSYHADTYSFRCGLTLLTLLVVDAWKYPNRRPFDRYTTIKI